MLITMIKHNTMTKIDFKALFATKPVEIVFMVLIFSNAIKTMIFKQLGRRPRKIFKNFGPVLANLMWNLEISKAIVIDESNRTKSNEDYSFFKSNGLLPWLLQKVIDYSN